MADGSLGAGNTRRDSVDGISVPADVLREKGIDEPGDATGAKVRPDVESCT